jgi:hypothetical protein
MPDEDARSMLRLLEERIRSSDIRVEHRDALIRLRAMSEDDLMAAEQDAATESREKKKVASLGGLEVWEETPEEITMAWQRAWHP